MNARKRAKRRAERARPTVVLQEEFRPAWPDPVAFRIPALDGNGSTVVVAVTEGQARRFGASVGMVAPEAYEAVRRAHACRAGQRVDGAASRG
jgi:hypothetical protein